ncbi:ABC transporter ATP-binding protein [Pseudoclavibacter endophyticus]|uniref:ABC transporter ATP-binding protein n=1 Tax=Pseudoclavibacter endophyticus TaxID=1778590 RepID=A0A6H9WM86_9MICO|nr:ABC transporter ATP-binding protein [Pseudoclavibacter endophyticus]KAB1650283.1 ABC transporter ATP-binding protein [Pseudoclavibacter endophyticus]GGA55494.1 ABC transporter ATP-binding protein [Pseudoclavibacter endophyticus]
MINATQSARGTGPSLSGAGLSADGASGAPLLELDDLHVRYRTSRGHVDAVRGVSLSIAAGETVAIVGESGSGKSTTAHAIIRMLAASAEIPAGAIRFGGVDLANASNSELRAVRGREIGFVPQDPTVSLNPVKRLGDQVGEVLRIHGLADRRSAAVAAVEALAQAGIPDPELRARQYPHELSGGLRQRVLIAIAVIARPRLLLADEPTSALDVTVQAQLLDHLDALQEQLGMGMLLITHDLGVAADRADRIAVMSQGRIVETGEAAQVLLAPQHPYTRRLIDAAPSLHTTEGMAAPLPRAIDAPAGAPGRDADAPDALVVATDLVKSFDVRDGGGSFRAVDGVGFELRRGETFALVGESGSGKSTTARLVLGLETPTQGRVTFDGVEIAALRGSARRAFRRRAQIVHQNPYASLNPRLTVAQIIRDPLDAFREGTRAERDARVRELIELVALPPESADRRPAELSGGQRQRVAIARALAIKPELIVLDEPVSALDVSVQHQILTLLVDIQRRVGVGYLFISHDLAVVRQIAHRVGVLRFGSLVETGPVDRVLLEPQAEYTRTLIDAIPGSRLAAVD